MRAILVTLVFGLITGICYPQTKQNINDIRNIFDEKGDYYFDKKDYKRSLVYYNKAYQTDASNYYSILKKAEAYTSLGLYDQAIECYRIIFETNLEIPNEYRLKHALLLLKNKDIVGFEKAMGAYNKIVRGEIYDYQSGTDIRAKMYYDSSVVIVENESVLNTPESEICPVICNDRVLFASTRKNLSGSPGNDYNLFVASYLNSGQLGRLNVFNHSLNSAQDESPAFCSDMREKLFFTRNTTSNSNLKTFTSGIPVNTSDIVKINEFLPEGFIAVGHVTFNSNGTSMYFVSAAPGGNGGLDIYTSVLSGGKWGKPVNLGPHINSGKDEMYPFVLNDTILFFTSAGHNGLGGFDLYSANLNRKNNPPVNLGSEINSAYDDFSLSFSSQGLTGYFCSNRPGGFGKEDIYRVHLMDIKVKYPAFRFKNSGAMEDGKINLYLTNGEEYNIVPDKTGFNFSFQPEENYKLIIQHENPLVSNIIYNSRLSADQKRKEFLYPEPFKKNEIGLQAGVKYLFTLGADAISSDYKNLLNETSKDYDNTDGIIDLTVLAKELPLKEGEIYTIQFVRADGDVPDSKTTKTSMLFFNEKTVNVGESSFSMVIPLKNESNFTIQTDLVHLKKAYPPKKAGMVKVDTGPVYIEEQVKLSEGFPILVNTETFKDATRKITTDELSIIPGTPYILTFENTSAGTADLGIVIPLTKGVKYNLGNQTQSKTEYSKALSQISAGQTGNNGTIEELIDISVLSKELDIFSERDIVFNLMPVKQFASQNSDTRNVLTTLSVDGRKYFITHVQKLQVNLKINRNEKINIQTDLTYVKENFDPSAIAIKVDTSSINTDLAEKRKAIITDPVYDVIVVNFNFNDYAIREDAKKIIADKVIEVLRSDSRLYVTIKGYTDPLGDAAHNERLSMNRAIAVKDFLTSNGIGENRIRTFSFGATQALKEGVNWKDLSEAELEKHRKVEIVIYLPK